MTKKQNFDEIGILTGAGINSYEDKKGQTAEHTEWKEHGHVDTVGTTLQTTFVS